MVRGEIWWAELPSPRGSEPAKRRPVLILQADSFNSSAIGTIICAVITSNIDLARAPGNILLEKTVSGLEKTSVINVSQIITIDRRYFIKLVGMLPKSMMIHLEGSLRLVLDIS
ncbi:MAG: type II toxin-antitoxin system PemK/MazF family toxin [Spirochaetales bacterium]|nr:type II toxin-antitoxin system PemK/MazF family toxin [Spirochaetales bacterium]